ncbi:hypothetical protein [Xylophilus sp.]|uniref:hypothetical protein n=1 Tax=Xylophilus sp. TaxID=2653893 RepID=UPI002D7F0F06|nr:hypothetical protein [Xylophilus sp.]
MKILDQVSDLIDAATALQSTLIDHTEWDEGCLYYNGISVPELQAPMASLHAAIQAARSAA